MLRSTRNSWFSVISDITNNRRQSSVQIIFYICRHKIVVTVNIGQMQGQDIRASSRCLWQPQHDDFAEANYKGKDFWSTATVYGVYQE